MSPGAKARYRRHDVSSASTYRAAGLPPGTRLGRYVLLRRLAVGGMAEVYLAHQGSSGTTHAGGRSRGFAKIVALKRISPHLASDPQFTRMFLDEARLAATLDHPNIAQVLDFGEVEGEHYLTMEYVHGHHLLDVLRAHHGQPLALPVALGIVAQIGRALHHVHEQRDHDGRPLGLVHRDVSPSNVLISADGAVKLTDFGIAKAMELTSATRTGTFKGKLGYASPEQCRGDHVDRRSDVFALGILLYETTTGARAFAGPNEFAVLGKVARADYTAPERVIGGYPAALRPIVTRALAADPDHRHASAAALADDLDHLAHELGLRSPSVAIADMMRACFGAPPPVASEDELTLVTSVTTSAGTTSVGTRVRPLPWLSAAAAVTALTVGAWAWGRSSVQPPSPSVVAPPLAVPTAASVPAAAIASPSSAPIVVPAPVVVTERATVEAPAAVAPARPAAEPRRKSPRSRRRSEPRGAVAAPAPASDLADLYPPGHPR